MLKILGLGGIVVGAILLFYGVNERNSMTSQVKEVFTGSPTDHSLLLMCAGGGLAAIGLGLVAFARKA